MNDLPTSLQPQTLLIYVGFGGNYTGGHVDHCGTLGHNLMVYAEPDAYAVWFVVGNKDVTQASKLWQKKGEEKWAKEKKERQKRGEERGGEAEREKHNLHTDNFFLDPEAFSTASFVTYVIRQREGDFVFLPPNVPHQVANMGGKSVKVAWNRHTAKTVERAVNECIPLNRPKRKNETYRLKASAFHALNKKTELAKQLLESSEVDGQVVANLLKDFPPLLRIVADILWEEMIDKESEAANTPISHFAIPAPHTRVCNVCHCDIFNRCFHCPTCGKPSESDPDTDYDACLECVAAGKGCKHLLVEPKVKLYESIKHEEVQTAMDSALDIFCALAKKHGKEDICEEVRKAVLAPKPEHMRSIVTVACEKMATSDKRDTCHSEFSAGDCRNKREVVSVAKMLCCSKCKLHHCVDCVAKIESFPHLMASLRNKSWECTTCLKSGQNPGNAARLQAKTELPEKEKTATEAANKKRPYETPKANLSALPKIPKKAKPTVEKPHKKSPAQPTQNSAQKSIKNSTPNPHNVTQNATQNATQNLTQKSPPHTQQPTPPLTLLQLGLQHKNSEMQQFTPHSPEFMQSSQSMYTSYQQYVTQPPAQYHNKSYRRTSNQSQS